MTAEWLELVNTWGYWLMALGAIIEGETFLVMGGVAAANKLLHLPGLIALAIVGCLIHDGFFFSLGKLGGNRILARRPKWQSKVEKVTRLLDKYDYWIILGFRFAYGLRTVIPFALGLSRISLLKFAFFDILGGIIWSSIFILGGYFFGHAMVIFLKQLSLIPLVKQHWILAIIILAGLLCMLLFIIHFTVRRIRNKSLNRHKAEEAVAPSYDQSPDVDPEPEDSAR